jgi:hypothetical protein
MSTDTLRGCVRFISMAAVIVAASGVLGNTGRPLYAAVGDATLKWAAAVHSEREKLRRKVTGGVILTANSRQKRRHIEGEPRDG